MQDNNFLSPFNEAFCTDLAFRLGKVFSLSERQELNSFWCDGISWQPLQMKQLSKKHVNDTRKIITQAWMGKNGQDEYEMTIHFGKYALRRYAKGTDMRDCIPSVDSMGWVDIDPKSSQIAIWLK